jgi:hypothetical protein
VEAVQNGRRQGRSERRGDAYSELYVEPLSDARTKLAAIFKGLDMDEDDIELPILPRLDKGPPPDCPICGDPMSFIDGDWACVDCNGELLGPETG